MNTPEKFIYTNSNTVKPVVPEKLMHIAGFGNSEVVQYNGAGAYFLDRLENGVWRLEVMPDAVWIEDPFTRTSPKKKIAVINWNVWQMTLKLSDLGENFSVTAVNSSNAYKPQGNGPTFEISPGSYLIKRNGVTSKFTASTKWNNITVGEFAAPSATVKKTYVIHEPVNEVSQNAELRVKVTVVSAEKPTSVELFVMGQGGSSKFLKMDNVTGYEYWVLVPKQYLEQGFLRYNIVVSEKEKSFTYPSGNEGRPWLWDFYDDKTYVTRIVPPTASIYLFDAATDADELSRQWVRSSSLMPLNEPGKAELLINVEKLFTSDPENVNAERIYDYAARYYFGKKISGRRDDVSLKKKLIVRARSLNDKNCPLQVALITSDGMAYGGIVNLEPKAGEHLLTLRDLKQVKLVTLPRPYPTFLPYYFKGGSGKELDLIRIETIQLSIGPGIPENELQNKHGIAIESIRIE